MVFVNHKKWHSKPDGIYKIADPLMATDWRDNEIYPQGRTELPFTNNGHQIPCFG